MVYFIFNSEINFLSRAPRFPKEHCVLEGSQALEYPYLTPRSKAKDLHWTLLAGDPRHILEGPADLQPVMKQPICPCGPYVKFTLTQAMTTQSGVGVELYSFFNRIESVSFIFAVYHRCHWMSRWM